MPLKTGVRHVSYAGPQVLHWLCGLSVFQHLNSLPEQTWQASARAWQSFSPRCLAMHGVNTEMKQRRDTPEYEPQVTASAGLGVTGRARAKAAIIIQRMSICKNSK